MRLTMLGDTQAELRQLANDPRVAPTWVLPRKAQHKLSHPTVGRRTARSPPRLRPLATHKLSVPAQQRLRRHHQSVAPAGREQSGERRKQRAIGWPHRGSSLLPSEHRQLMVQHEQLNVFGELAALALTSKRSTAEKAR
jgi:hypothetical protein